MKKIVIAVLALCAINWSCKQEKKEEVSFSGFEITGHIENLPDQNIYLIRRSVLNRKIDTAKVVNGKFSFKGDVKMPSIGSLSSDDKSVNAKFYLENLKITVNGKVGEVTVKGNQSTEEYKAFRDLLEKPNNQYGVLKDSIRSLSKHDEASKETLEILADEQFSIILSETEKFIKQHPNSYVSLNELGTLMNFKDPNESLSIFNGLNAEIKNSEGGKKLESDIKSQLVTAIGAIAPNFTQPDTEGNLVTLSDIYKDNYVLVDFWASWCGPCRAENPNVKKVYEKYHDKGFEVVGVSIDKSKEKWLKAIEEDQIPWIHLSDLKAGKNEAAIAYGIRAVPSTFLLDKEGKIIARSLRGAELEAKLDEIFSK